jgi:hypothetical protein
VFTKNPARETRQDKKEFKRRYLRRLDIKAQQARNRKKALTGSKSMRRQQLWTRYWSGCRNQ